MTEFSKQKAARPKLEDVMQELVKEEHRLAALDFVGYIRSHKMTPAWASINSWKCSFKGKGVVYIRVEADGDWRLQLFAQYDPYLHELVSGEAGDVQEYVKERMGHHDPCGGCMPGVDRKTVNKEMRNICGVNSLHMTNPDERLLEFARKLVALRRDAILNGRVPKCSYIKPADRS